MVLKEKLAELVIKLSTALFARFGGMINSRALIASVRPKNKMINLTNFSNFCYANCTLQVSIKSEIFKNPNLILSG